MAIRLIPGVYGKLPALGDFVARYLPSEFIFLWDEWLQRALQASRTKMGAQWLDDYLTCPIYRFVLGPGSCGERAAVGVIMPSVDKVGRYFPFTLVALADRHTPLGHLLLTHTDWMDRLEQLALSVLEDAFNLTEFEAQLQANTLVMKTCHATGLQGDTAQPCEKHQAYFSTRMEIANGAAMAYGNLCNRLLHCTMPAYSIWSTNGSKDMAPSFTVFNGLPPVYAYADFLSGLGPQVMGREPIDKRCFLNHRAAAAVPQHAKGDVA